MKSRVLFVDDDEELLKLFSARLSHDFDFETANSPTAGLGSLEKGEYKVVISDYDMPETNGIEFLRKVKLIAPNVIRMMLTATQDLDVATSAVNQGEVFRFISKPVSHAELALSIHECIQKIEVTDAERNLLENTLNQAVKVLLDMLAMVSPLAFSRANRLRIYTTQLAELVEIEDIWQVNFAAMLSHIGCISVPPEVLQKVITGESLGKEEEKIYNTFPSVGADIISQIPKLEATAEIIRNQRKEFKSFEKTNLGEDIQIGAQILHLVSDFDLYMESEGDVVKTLARLQANASDYNPKLLEFVDHLAVDKENMHLESVKEDSLAPGMIFAEEVNNNAGILLIPEGVEVGVSGIAILRNFAELKAVPKSKLYRVYAHA